MDHRQLKRNFLWIRACKSKNPRKRLQTLYNRLYLTTGEVDEFILAAILMEICTMHCPISAKLLLSEMSPHFDWKYGGDSYWDKAVNVLIGHIQMTNCDDIEGWITPRRFQKNQ